MKKQALKKMKKRTLAILLSMLLSLETGFVPAFTAELPTEDTMLDQSIGTGDENAESDEFPFRMKEDRSALTAGSVRETEWSA
ncbi:MAG: hypothetical protein K6F53_11180 [Lachnospiraceae bacterium]|nr:hypothetical protein [Lachnospiraceae bacterium]